MKLDDFLKVKKVRCVSIGGYSFITVGKEYDVVGVDRDSVLIVNDDESEGFYSYRHFEPVLDSAENPPQGAELTPGFEAVAPHVSPPHLTMALPMLVSLTTMCCFHVLKSVKRHIAHG